MTAASLPAQRSALPLLAWALLVVLVGGLVLQLRFLPLADFGQDGFQAQLVRVLLSLQNGSVVEDSSEGALIYVHVVRLVAVAPFLGAELVAGPTGQVALLAAVLLPLALHCYRQTGSLLCLAALLLPLGLSGRGVLVAAGVGYLVLYMQSPLRRWWHLWLGALLVTLSSASVLMAVLLLLFARVPAPQGGRGPGGARWLVLALLAAALLVSAIDKVAGFQSGEAGYEAHGFAADNVVLVAISRSTLVTSFVEGQYLRATVYTVAAFYLLVKTVALMFSPGRSDMRKVVLCCLPGIPLEGMGMLGLSFPVLWLFLGYAPAGALLSSRGVSR